VNIDTSEWRKFLKRRAERLSKGNTSPTKKPSAKNTTGEKDKRTVDTVKLRIQELQERVREKEIKNEILYLQMQKNSGNVIEYALAEFLFLGHLEKLHIDLLRIGKKIEPIIDNLVKERRTREIIKRYQNEIETSIREVKKASAEDVKKWDKENKGRKS